MTGWEGAVDGKSQKTNQRPHYGFALQVYGRKYEQTAIRNIDGACIADVFCHIVAC